jgi:hypothetical protein
LHKIFYREERSQVWEEVYVGHDDEVSKSRKRQIIFYTEKKINQDLGRSLHLGHDDDMMKSQQ